MRINATKRLEVIVTEPGRLYEQLNSAEAALQQAAVSHRQSGILVTRHHPGHYTLTLSNKVPFGELREQILA
jgi:hypothetical protein